MFTIQSRQNGLNKLAVINGQESQIIHTASALCISILLASAFVLVPDLAEAATTATATTTDSSGTTTAVKGSAGITKGYDVIKGLVNGVVGKTIAIVSFLFGLIASAFKFNPPAIAGSFGVSLTATFGPDVIESVVGATF